VLDGIAPDDDGAGADVLVSNDFADDAAVVRLDGGTSAAVLTADVIAPLVDDPETFGEIAATNSISDVYAMGGTPLYALNLVFFPDDQLPIEVLHAILRGGARACKRMGVAIVGGHTIRDGDVKYGLSVTGTVDADRILSNRRAKAGQVLVITKPLGTGIIGTVIKKQLASSDQIDAAVAAMTTPNASALEIALAHGVTACTDVTGFGLLGHLRNILIGSSLAARIDLASLPLLPGAVEHAADGYIPGGSKANLAFLEPCIRRADGVDPIRVQLAADAQTSGGLLLCCPEDSADALVADLRARDLTAAIVGELAAPAADRPAGTIDLE
jgi:selenide,water dikinase